MSGDDDMGPGRVQEALTGLAGNWASGVLTADEAASTLTGLGYDRNVALRAVELATPARGQEGSSSLRHHAVIFAGGSYRIEQLFTPDQLRGGALSVRVLVDAQNEATTARFPASRPDTGWPAVVLAQAGRIGQQLIVGGTSGRELYHEVIVTAAALLAWAETLRPDRGERP